MFKKDDFVQISDLESIKRALENAEIDYEEYEEKEGISIETGSDIQFDFDKSGSMLNIVPIRK